jgi:hypothetical protein
MSTPERTVPSGRGGWRRTNAHRKLRYRSAALSARSFAQAVSRYRSRRVSTRPHRRGTGLDKLARFRSSARSEGRRCRIAAARCARVRGSAAADFCPVHRSREWAGSHVGEAQQRVADAKHVAGKAQGALSISADVNESAWRRWRALPLAPKPVSTESAVVEWQGKVSDADRRLPRRRLPSTRSTPASGAICSWSMHWAIRLATKKSLAALRTRSRVARLR